AVPSFAMPSAFPPLPVVPRCAGLTVEEVAALDGIEERANTEVLINYIRNIGLLLDTVAMQLQQLISIVQPVSVSTNPAATTNTNTTTPPNDATLPETPTVPSGVIENSAHHSSECACRKIPKDVFNAKKEC
ncbi:unnamed protein product, partial [Onchocerca ochengi]|uniref:MitMem_reg domain-containing protein n=1 Tax=Onchocerca ochengi TaxID=42157 RepID=A0A182EX79_ONCOC